MSRLTVNGEPLAFDLDPQTPLLFALRDAANITGPKHGCDDGGCHACTVLVDGQPVRACSLPLSRAEGAQVVTVEGLPPDHPIFAAWIEAQPTMCGMCDPGFLCAIVGLLQVNAAPGDDDLAAIPNRCPCGAGPRIREAIVIAARVIQRDGDSSVPATTSGFSLGSDAALMNGEHSQE